MTARDRAPDAPPEGSGSAAAVLRNRPFLLLWLSQLTTQIGVNMVLYGLTVVVLEATDLSSAVSGLFLTFLVPSVQHTDDMVDQVDFSLLSIGRLDVGDRVVVVAGSPPNTVGSTNLIRVHEVGTDS